MGGVELEATEDSNEVIGGTNDDGISELVIPNGGGRGSIPTEVGSGRSESISGSEFGLFGLVARSIELSLQKGKFPAWLGGS